MVRRWALVLVMVGVGGACRREGGGMEKGSEARVTRAEAGGVSVMVRVDRTEVMVAEPIEMAVEVRAKPGVEARFPERVGGEFVVREAFDEEAGLGTDRLAGERVWKRRYWLERYAGGEFEIPGVAVTYVNEHGEEGEVRTEPIAVRVTSAAAEGADPTRFHDIKGPVEMERPWAWRAMWWAAAVSALAAAGLVGVWYWRRRRPAAASVVPADVWALGELEALAGEGLTAREFYYRLNGLVREYVERRFGLAAAEQTSEEFLRALRDEPRLSEGHKEGLRAFVAACDPVKYARYEPGEEEREAVVRAARGFVEQTREKVSSE